MVKVSLPLNATSKRNHQTQVQNASTNGGSLVSRRFFQQPRLSSREKVVRPCAAYREGHKYIILILEGVSKLN